MASVPTPATRKPGTQPKHVIFSTAQVNHINSFIPELEDIVTAHDPKFLGHDKEITAWKQKTATHILTNEVFSTESIQKDHQNWVKMKKRQAPIAVAAEPSAKGDMQNLICSKLLFTADFMAYDLFIDANEVEITHCYQELARKENIPGGGARAKVIKEMWENADHEEWQGKVEEARKDIEKYVKQPYYIG
ncbi:hypothetical protein H0H81_011513 [Sphagnurus paluster]|uniref:Uncharacterized protein n=1 Tax=Sphagnurus paluster TaxID=117069 RepID=A0A9P7GII0_9AGAR|nr:hypothetical protein H0H81_011513 [Sphagnurus paluster]